MEINLYNTESSHIVHDQTVQSNTFSFIPRNIHMVLHDPLCVPEYRTKGSAGADLKVAKDVVLLPHTTQVVATGVSLAIPDGYVGLVFPRSGLASKGVTLANSVGVIDSDYRGEIMVALKNVSTDPIVVKHGDRVAQIVFMLITQFPFTHVQSLDSTVRGTGGFGSTGS